MFQVFHSKVRYPVLALAFSLLGTPGSLSAKPPSLSSQGVFLLQASSSPAAPVSRLLAGYERNFFRLTGYSPGDALPVVVVLHDAADITTGLPLLRLDTLEGGGSRIQVDLAEDSLKSRGTARCLAMAMLLREHYGGQSPRPGSKIVEIPSWVLHGLGFLCNPGSVSPIIPTSYLRGGAPPEIGDLLTRKPPQEENVTIGEIHDALCAYLLLAGLRESGTNAFRNWIGHFDPKSPGARIPPWPPGWEMSSVERRWLLLIPGRTGTPGEEFAVVPPRLTLSETMARYDDLLSGIGTPGHSLALLRRERGAPYTVGLLGERLTALRLQAHPLADPLLDGTIRLCATMMRLSEKKISSGEKSLSELRASTLARARAIEEYIDWYEAAKTPVRSGLFDRLLETREASIRKGPVGRCLDAVEARGW